MPAKTPSPRPAFFASPELWREWLERNHDRLQEFWVGFYKRDSGKPSITWPQAVDGALCFGWIDGLRKSLDATRYMIRFTPRRPRSVWSAVNIRRVAELIRLGLMHPAGHRAFDRRESERSEIYAYEQRRKHAQLTPAYQKQFRANRTAWKFFQAQPPWYRRTSSWWVISAKKEETRQKRLATLIDCSAQRRSLHLLARPQTK